MSREKIAALKGEGNILHRAHHAVAGVKGGREMFNVEQRHGSVLGTFYIQCVAQAIAEKIQ